MNLQSLVVMLENLTAQDPLAAGLLELGARATLIPAFALLIGVLARPLPAAWRHLVWHGCFTALLLLPLFMLLPPLLEIPLAPVPEAPAGADAGWTATWTAVFGNGAGRRWLIPAVMLPAALLALRTLLGLLSAALLTRASRPVTAEARSLLDELVAEAGDSRRIALREHGALLAPASWGLLRPVILLPEEARAWPRDQLRQALLHELAHVGRLDWLSQLMARLACALYWYNPLVWLAARRLEQEAECACDDAVLLHGQSGGDYAKSLLAIARRANGGRRALIVQAMAESFLGRRLTAILDGGVRRDASEGVYLLRALLASLPLLAAIATAEFVPGKTLPAMQLALGNLIPVHLAPVARSATTAPGREATRAPSRPSEAQVLEPPQKLQRQPSALVGAPALPYPDMLEGRRVESVMLPPLETEAPARILRPVSTPSPAYPVLALAQGLEGFSVVEFDVTATGDVVNATVVDSAPGSVFDRASLDAVLAYRYEPQLLGGEAVTVRGLRTRFVYRLRPAPD